MTTGVRRGVRWRKPVAAVSKNQELKPCPFCGAKARTLKVWNNVFGIDLWYVGCDVGHTYCPCHVWNLSPLYTTEELAVEIWNTRWNADDTSGKGCAEIKVADCGMS